MTGKYKLIALDMDGTLLNQNKEITETCQAAVREACRAGKEVVFCSGRSPSELREYLEILPEVNYVIGASGGVLYHAGQRKLLCKHSFEQGLLGELVKRLSRVNKEAVFVCVAGIQAYTTSPHCFHISDYLGAACQELFSNSMIHVMDMEPFVRWKSGMVEKFSAYFRTWEEWEAAKELIRDLEPKMAVATTGVRDIECTPLGVTKALGLQDLSRYLDIPVEEMIMVGDSENDLAALKAAGLSLAMENGIPEAKEIADSVVPDNEHNGAAYAIRHYLLEG